jgi:hypothetical protein
MSSSYPSETDNQRRTEFIGDARGASSQRVTIEAREAAREAKADAWVRWLHARIDTRGGEAIQHLPDALAELEERINDEVAGAMRELKAALTKALK